MSGKRNRTTRRVCAFVCFCKNGQSISVLQGSFMAHNKVQVPITIFRREGGSIIREEKIVRDEINILLILQLTFYDIRYFEEVT